MIGGRCRRCGAPLRWVTTESGRSAPAELDVTRIVPFATGQPRPKGVPRISGFDEAGRCITGRPAIGGDLPESTVEVRESHFARCPGASGFRKPKGTVHR